MNAAAQSSQTSTVRTTLDALVQTLKRWQFWLLLLVFGAIVTLAVQLISTEDTERYGLENTDLDGYAALARTLEDQGVELHRTYSGADAAAHLEEAPEAAVVVLQSSLHLPSDDTVEELTAHAQEHPVIWISPDGMLLAQLGDEQAPVSYTHLTLPTNREV